MPNPVVDELIAKTLQELYQPEKPLQRSRISQTPNGYIFLVPWSNACVLRIMVRRFTDTLPKKEFRLKAQLDDAIRSVVANIEEGYGRPTTSQYLDFLGYSQASLIEVKGDVERSRQDEFLKSRPGTSLKSLGIDLKDWHEKLKASVISKPVEVKGIYRSLEEVKGGKNWGSRRELDNFPLNSFKFLYPPIDDLRGQDLTYEIFIELINKTDWHLRRLVESLEEKLSREQKYYQVEKLRLKKTFG